MKGFDRVLYFGIVLIILSTFALSAVDDAHVYYSFDNANLSGSNPIDLSGNNNIGANINANTGVTGIIAEAFEYNGAGDVVNMNTSLDKSATGAFCMWLEPDALSHYLTLTGSTTTNRQNIYAYFSGDETTVGLRNDAGNKQWEFVTDSVDFVVDNFYHICVTQNGVSPDIFVNGTNVSKTFTTTTDLTKWTSLFGGAMTHSTIGKYSTTYFDGIIDEFELYKHPLSAAEISQLYNNHSGFNPYNIVPSTAFELTLSNIVGNVSLTDFTATIQNGSSTINITTTNGTVVFPLGSLFNITVFDIMSGTYFNQSRSNHNSTVNLQLQTWQSVLITTSQRLETGTAIAEFNLTVSGQTVTTTNGTTIHLLNASSNAYDGRAAYFDTNSSGSVTLTALQTLSHVINFTTNNTNHITFLDASTGSGIFNGSVVVTYPSSATDSFLTNTTGGISFSYIKSGTEEFGTYSVSFARQGYIPSSVSPVINISNSPINTSFNVSQPAILVNIFDKETGSVFTNLAEVILLEVLNTTTNNGSVTIQNTSIISGSYVLQVKSEGYLTEQKTFTFTNQENVTTNFYLLNSTGSNSAFVFISVVDESDRILQDATVSIFQYDTVSAAFIKVSEVETNVNGEAVFGIELNVKTYFFTASKTIDGASFEATTSPEIFLTADETRELTLKLLDPFQSQVTDKLVITFSETFVNNISTIFLEYTTRDGFVAEVCVGYFNVSGNNTLLNEQCVNSSAAYAASPTLIERTHTYQGKVYQKFEGARMNIATYTYKSISSFDFLASQFQYSKPIFVWLWILLLIVSLLLKNMMFFTIGGIALSWIQFFRSPSVALVSASVLKTMILIFMMNSIRRRVDIS